MLEKILKASVLGIILILLSSAVMARQMEEEIAETQRKGPRTEELVMKYYNNVTEAYAALKVGEIDILPYRLSAELYDDAVSDPNILVAGYAGSGVYAIYLNNNYTIHRYRGVESPMWYREVRRAVAWCTDKDYIVDVICGGFAERIDAPIGAPSTGWANESYIYPNYPYEYDPARAAAELDAAGWAQGSTPNPSYDAGFPGSAQCLRTYPPGHSKQGENVDPLRTCIRIDDIRRWQVGNLICDALEKIGLRCNRIEGDSPTLYTHVMVEKNYHMYILGGTGFGYYPLYLYTAYHSSNWQDGVGSINFYTGNNASNLPNYPEYDRLAERVYYPNSLEEAVHAAKLATAYWTKQCINIPVFSNKYCGAYSADVLGLVRGWMGIENDYSFMNCYKADGSPIRYGSTSPPNSMNPQRASFYSSYQTLERSFGYAQFSSPPYDNAIAQADSLQDWELGEWNDDGTYKLTRTDWIRNDSYFTEPITGNQLTNVNAKDYYFSIWYTYADPAAWRHTSVQDIHHVEIHSNYSWTVYFDAPSFFWYYLTADPMLMLYPVDLWLRDPLALEGVENFTGFIGPGQVSLNGSPVWINNVTVDGAPLAFGTDYNIIRGNLEILAAVSGDLSVDYWKYGDPSGYTPGNLPWEEILVGSGMYYMIGFTPGVGGGATFKRNPYYWMETPPIGEVDFVWKWIDGPKPRSGYYKVDIYDIVMAIGEYGSDGTGIPDSATEHRRWFPGADFAPPGGKINIYDIVSMVGQYGQTFGAP